ncbi:MAG: hypothetical protein HOP11_10330 [Saprospiraceae bacterium]|nr:hypothetical protein [Saprospiraceae bacterium]
MKDIFRFAGLFILCYFVCIFLYRVDFVKSMINKPLRSYSVGWISSFLPSAEISQQNIAGKSGIDAEMYLIYGNPILIEKAKKEAKQSGQAYATIPTKSMELHLFEMFVVPVFFLISLFIATPLILKEKMKGLLISLLIIFMFISIKLICLSTFEISNSRIGIYELGDSEMKTLSILLGVFSLGFTLMLSFILWLVFGFKKSNFVQIFNSLFKNA